MKEYYLDIAGLRTCLRTPFEISISENLRPFLTQKNKKIDCTITLQSTTVLPAAQEGGRWHGPEYYHGNCIYHCSTPKGQAFAVTQLLENGNIEITVLPEFISYFSGTGGIFNRIGLETLLLQHSGLLLHASLIKYAGQAIAFAGPSGVGKSTQADIWHRYLGAKIINGDRAALRKTQTGWLAYGSSYAGTSGIYKNDNAPLAAIVLLEQGRENRFSPLTGPEAFRRIYPELSVHQWEEGFVAAAADLCLQLLSQVPVSLLECLPDESAAQLVKKGLGL